MNSSESAKKGFRTFILTLSISLIVFSVVYYLIEGSQSDSSVSNAETEEYQATSSGKETGIEVTTPKTSFSAFEKLAYSKSEGNPKEVLAGSTVSTVPTSPNYTSTPIPTSPQSSPSVPNGGTLEITLGLVSSILIFASAVFLHFRNPRKLALASFEKDLIQGIDRYGF